MLWVHPGDTIRADIFAKYARLEQTQNNSQLIAMAAIMKNLSPIDNAVEMRKALQMLGSSDFRSLPAWGKLNDAQPPAFLNGLLFDKDMKLQTFDFDQVSEKARMKAIEDNKDHEKLELEFVAEKEGYLYIYISNESKENLDVYFDDLKVTHVYGTVVAGGDYYSYGLPIEDRQITLEDYRFGYQGQFAEKDEETGWSHFDLREYDSFISRWVSVDPQRQYFSPYVGMGNNPVAGVDPSGGFKVPIHQRIVRNAAQGLFNNKDIAYLEKGVAYTDEASNAGLVDKSSYLHFDGLTTYTAIVSNYNRIQNDIDRVITSPTGNIFHIAFYAHAIQDFYLHSNYVELYLEYFGPGWEISTFQEVISDQSGFFDMFKDVLKARLVTGKFNLFAEIFGKGGENFFGYNYKETHAYLNKDRANTRAGEIAEQLATKETRMILRRAKQ